MANPAEEPWHRPLIQTKLRPPRRQRCLVPRRALVERLGTRLEYKLTLVTAPAGYGKTTLLSEWRDTLVRNGYLVAWLSLDTEDDDLHQFLAYILASIDAVSPDLASRTKELLKHDPLAPARTMLSALINTIASAEGQLVLILDDYDSLVSAEINDAVSKMLRYAPENFFGVIAGRAEPALPFRSFLAANQLLRISSQELRFGIDEATHYFAQTALPRVESKDVAKLCEATDGWVAGLQLAALALNENGDAAHVAEILPKATRDIDEYLAATVIARLPLRIVDFLLRTSVLDRLCPDLCNSLLVSNDGAEILGELLERNLFLREADDAGVWYQYHGLFSSFLRRRLSRQRPNEIVGLHRRASQWFAEQDLWLEAISHALAAGDLEQATSWIESKAMVFVERGDVRTVLGLVSKLPPEASRHHFRLRMAHAWSLALSLKLVDARAALDAIKIDVQRIQSELTAFSAAIAGLSDDGENALVLGQQVVSTPMIGSVWARGIAQTAMIFGLVVHSRFDEVRPLLDAWRFPADANEPIYTAVYRQTLFGYCAYMEGRLADAAELIESALASAESRVGRTSATAAVPAGYAAGLAYERNDLDRASQIVHDRLSIALEVSPIGSLGLLSITLARIKTLCGEKEEAAEVLGQTQRVAHARRWTRLEAECLGERIRLHLHAGELGLAESSAADLNQLVLQLNGAPDSWPTNEIMHTFRIAQSRLFISTGRASEAIVTLRQLVPHFLDARRHLQVARVRVLLGIALERAGQREQALAEIIWALQFSQKNGMVRTFVDERPDLTHLLSEVRGSDPLPPDISPTYIDFLIATINGDSSRKFFARDGVGIGALRPREIDILDCIARGLTNKEIARTLSVTPETVKWYLKHIYEKLNVSSRIQAVQKYSALNPASRHGN